MLFAGIRDEDGLGIVAGAMVVTRGTHMAEDLDRSYVASRAHVAFRSYEAVAISVGVSGDWLPLVAVRGGRVPKGDVGKQAWRPPKRVLRLLWDH